MKIARFKFLTYFLPEKSILKFHILEGIDNLVAPVYRNPPPNYSASIPQPVSSSPL